MKFSLSWLKDHLDTDASAEALADKLTNIGLEVEDLSNPAKALAPFREEMRQVNRQKNAEENLHLAERALDKRCRNFGSGGQLPIIPAFEISGNGGSVES